MEDSFDIATVWNAISVIATLAFLLVALDYSTDKGNVVAESSPLLSPFGRIGRARFLAYLLVGGFAAAILSLVFRIIVSEISPTQGLFCTLPVVPFIVMAAAKRFRDAGVSPYWSVLSAVPFIALFANLFCLLVPSKVRRSVPAQQALATPRQPPPSELTSAPAPGWLTKSARPSPQHHAAPLSSALVSVPAPNGERCMPASATDSVASSVNSSSERAREPSAPVNEEQLWATALAELEEKRQRPGLWARAFSEAMGEDNKARALYLAHRVKQLESERPDGEPSA